MSTVWIAGREQHLSLSKVWNAAREQDEVPKNVAGKEIVIAGYCRSLYPHRALCFEDLLVQIDSLQLAAVSVFKLTYIYNSSVENLFEQTKLRNTIEWSTQKSNIYPTQFHSCEDELQSVKAEKRAATVKRRLDAVPLTAKKRAEKRTEEQELRRDKELKRIKIPDDGHAIEKAALSMSHDHYALHLTIRAGWRAHHTLQKGTYDKIIIMNNNTIIMYVIIFMLVIRSLWSYML